MCLNTHGENTDRLKSIKFNLNTRIYLYSFYQYAQHLYLHTSQEVKKKVPMKEMMPLGKGGSWNAIAEALEPDYWDDNLSLFDLPAM